MIKSILKRKGFQKLKRVGYEVWRRKRNGREEFVVFTKKDGQSRVFQQGIPGMKVMYLVPQEQEELITGLNKI